MKKYLKIIIILIILFIIIVGLFTKCNKKESDEALEFKDLAFATMLKKELNKEQIYATDLNEISGIMIAADRVLGLSGGGHTDKSVILFNFEEFEYKDVRYKEFGTIKSLEDLKYFPKLTSLRIYLQPNIDFETIPNKAKINNLGLSQNKLTNIKFLKGFDSLIYLSLSSNYLVDLSGIEAVNNIKRLNLNSNDVTNIELLKDFNNLEYLDLTYNNVLDIIPLTNLPKLNYLSLYENGISDITPLSNIKTIEELYLNNNNITDISPLKDFTSFKALNISNNPITNYDVINHIPNVTK